MRQGPYKSIILYKERFNNTLNAYVDQGNPKMRDEDIVMDFFRGLDNARYTGFKTEILNGLTAKSIMQPANLNAMYLLANQWVKPVTRANAAGFASTFHTMLSKTEKTHGNNPEGGGRHKGGRQKGGKHQPSQDKMEGSDRKDTIECFACGKMGHHANKCPQRKRAEDNKDENNNRSAHITWDESTFTTYPELSK
jgi:hypothetical protein